MRPPFPSEFEEEVKMARMDPFREVGVDFVTVMVSREKIEARDITPALGSLSALIESRETIRHFLGRVDLAIDGYDADPRELFEVPEVRTYLAALDERFPYWFPLLSLDTEALKLVTFSLCDIERVASGLVEVDTEDLRTFLVRHFGAMN
ncbi:MAG: chlororespiratory reduction 6 domain-containing protein, partial [Deferrisomatales bacterium]